MDARRRRADADDEAQAQADLGEVRGRDRGAVRGLNSERERAEEALALARKGVEAFGAGRTAEFWDLVADDCVVATDPLWPDGGEFHGIEESRRFFDRFTEAFAQVRFEEIPELTELVGRSALIRGNWAGPGAASGMEMPALEFTMLVASRDGLITEIRAFLDPEAAREAASRT